MARITEILLEPKLQNQNWSTSDEIEKGKRRQGSEVSS